MADATKSLDELFAELNSSERGLSSHEADRRLQVHGRNEIEATSRVPWWRILLSQFNSPVIWVLLGAVAVSMIIGEVVDAGVILVILVLNAGLGFTQEHGAEKSIEALRRMA